MEAWSHLYWVLVFFFLNYVNVSPQKKFVAVMKLCLIPSVSEKLPSTASATSCTGPRGKHISLSENLHRANTYRVTHCLFRLNSSKRNPGVPCCFSAVQAAPQRKAPHGLQPALCLQFTETMTRDKNKTLYLAAVIYWVSPAESPAANRRERHRLSTHPVMTSLTSEGSPEVPQPLRANGPTGKPARGWTGEK